LTTQRSIYLAPTGLGRRTGLLNRVDYQGAGAYVVAPPSRHPAGRAYGWVRDLDHPLPQLPAAVRAELDHHRGQRPAGAQVLRLPVADGPGPRYARAVLAAELARVAGAGVGGRNLQLWESARNLYNLVAAGALDPAEVERRLLRAADRNGLLAEEPRQTRRTLASARQVGLAHPRRPPERPSPDRAPLGREVDERARTPEGR
jgi:Bifunctional DNA primase/polymerase, N-terminal